MSLTITTDVFCDLCPGWVNGKTGGSIEAEAARQSAKGAGWQRIRVDNKLYDICKDCVEKHGHDMRSTIRKHKAAK
jgi:hypothetical protein